MNVTKIVAAVAAAAALSLGLGACGSSALAGFNNPSTLSSHLRSAALASYPEDQFSVTCVQTSQVGQITCNVNESQNGVEIGATSYKVTVPSDGKSYVITQTG
jgi:Zn-dependent metalloprotease